MRQFEAFLAAMESAERERLAELLTLISIGTHGQADAVKRLFKDLQRAD